MIISTFMANKRARAYMEREKEEMRLLYHRLFPQRKNTAATIIKKPTVEEINHTFRYNDLSEFLTITRDTREFLYFSLAISFSVFARIFKNEVTYDNTHLEPLYPPLLVQITGLISLSKLYLNFLVEEKCNYELNACLNNPLSGGPLYEEPTLLIQLDEVAFLGEVKDELTSPLDSPTIKEDSKIISTILYLMDQNSKSNPPLIRIKVELDKIGQGYAGLTDNENNFLASKTEIVEKGKENYPQNVNILYTYLASPKSLNKNIKNK